MADDFAMYGPAQSGERLYSLDSQQQALNQLSMLNTASLIQDRGAEMQMRQVEIQQKQLELANQQKMQKVLADRQAQQKQAQAAAMPDQLSQLADGLADQATMLSQAGMPKQAAELAEKSALIRSHLATANSAQAETAIRQATAIRTRLDTVAGLMADVHSQADLDKVNRQYGMYHPGETSPLPTTYQDGMEKTIVDGALGAKEKLELRERQLTEQSKTKREQLSDDIEHQKLQLEKRKVQLQEEAEARRRKTAGAKYAGEPSVREIKSANELFSTTFKLTKDVKAGMSDVDSDAFSTMTRDVASKARVLMHQNPGLDMIAAQSRVLQEGIKSGDYKIATQAGTSVLGVKVGSDTTKVDFKTGGDQSALAAKYKVPYDSKYEYRVNEKGGLDRKLKNG